ncbi:MAG: DNA/RNA nuclease SfsA [Deltaproteobacteria bacterium]|nr:DNA/RNA nuclease SfsA [Deltaproteobacteria bacterium]
MRFFHDIEKAAFLDRPNRFVVRCLKGHEETAAFLPNPGRLHELLLPGRCLYLTRDGVSGRRRYPWTVVAVERDGTPVMLHTHRTNDVARRLIDGDRVAGLEGARVVGSEITVGRSRFDLLLEHEGRELLMEVKSCTLAGNRIAMFPDAVTARGARHLGELAALSENGRETAVLFVVHWPAAEYFLPDYHTDLHFTRTMLACRDRIRFFPVSVRWNEDLTLDSKTGLLNIPWEFIEQEAEDRGGYLVILRVDEGRNIAVGKMGTVFFPPGYYVYAGSAMANLTARLERHRRLRKNLHWHIDYLRQAAAFETALPVRSSVSLECPLAEAMDAVADWKIPGFGSSDCSCPSHLFGMQSDPLRSAEFIRLLMYFRIDRLHPLLKQAG